MKEVVKLLLQIKYMIYRDIKKEIVFTTPFT